jgi:hypothetical protein
VYDESIAFLRRALDASKLGHTEKLRGLARLDTIARLVVERLSPAADVDVAIARERAVSRSLGGRTVFDDMKPRGERRRGGPSQFEPFAPGRRWVVIAHVSLAAAGAPFNLGHQSCCR